MSSNIEIPKKCEWCGNSFIAQKSNTRFCSHTCTSKAYKAKKRKEKSASLYVTNFDSVKAKPIEELRQQEFYSVAEAAQLLGVCRQTIYNLIQEKKLKAAQITNRLCIISRKDIDAMYEEAGKGTYRAKPNNEQRPIGELYTVAEIIKKYKIKESWLYKIAKENNIPKILIRGKSYFSKSHLDKYFEKKKSNEFQDIVDWFSVEDIQNKYNLSLSAIYSFVSENHIPRKKEGQKAYYSRKHFDIAKGYEKPAEPEYYSVEEAMLKFGMTRDALYNLIKYHNIPKVKEGRYIKVSKPDLNKLFDKQIII